MNWLRSNAKRLSLLALFALAIQLGLSFGHFHSNRAFASKTTITGQLAEQASTPSPDNGRDTDGRQDFCAICATVALTNALIDSASPVLPVPVETTAVEVLPVGVAIGASTHPLGFQSRAPPQS